MRERRDSVSPSVAMPMQIVPPKSIRSGPSSRSIKMASAWLAPVSRRAASADVAGDDAAAEEALGAGQGRDACRDLAAGEGLDQGERSALFAQRLKDHPF